MLSAFVIFLTFLNKSTSQFTYTVEKGSTVMLTCESTEIANISYARWFREQQLLSVKDNLQTRDPRLNVFRQFSLKIDSVQREDAGEYSCILKYDQSEQKITYKLVIFNSVDDTLNEEHYSSYYFSIIKAVKNQTVVLPCEVIHFSSCYGIEWEKDGEMILRKTQTSDMNREYSTIKTLEGFNLEIQNVQPQDAVEYICEMKNKSRIVYKLEVPDKSFDQSTDMCLPPPCGLNSECRTSADYPLCTCRKNNKGKPPNCIPNCEQTCTPYLTCLSEKCKDVCQSSCGLNARCIVQNYKYVCACPDNYFGDPHDECDKAPHTFTLSKESVGQTYEVSPNSNVILPCKSDDIDDHYQIVEWEKIPENTFLKYRVDLREPRMQLYTVYDLLIEMVKPQDEGEYICKILKDNPAYNITYKLEVIGISKNKDTVTNQTSDPHVKTIRVKVNSTVILPCEGVNLKFKHMKWEANADKKHAPSLEISNFGINLPGSRIKILRGINLEIQNVQAGDAGAYSCFMSDSFEKEKLSIVSHVLEISDSTSGDQIDPCLKFPCGENSECYSIKNKPVCSCRINHKGTPPYCTKDCVHDVDCFSIACVSSTCKNLCEQSCGSNGSCRIQKYLYTCMPDDTYHVNLNETSSSSFDDPMRVKDFNVDRDACGGVSCSLISIGGPVAFVLIITGTLMFLIRTRRREIKNEQNDQKNPEVYAEDNAAFGTFSRYTTNQTECHNGKGEPQKQQHTDKIEENQSIKDLKSQECDSLGHEEITVTLEILESTDTQTEC